MGSHFRKKEAKVDDDDSAAEKEPWNKQAFTYFRLLFSPGYCIWDVLLFCGGIVGGIAAGVPFPLLGILFGQLIDKINSANCTENTGGDTSSIEDAVVQKVLYIIYVTIANWCFIYINTTCWGMFGERLVRRLRETYLRSLLRQELAFFDNLPAGDVSSRLSNDLEDIQKGTSEKVGIVLSSTSYFVAAYIVAFIKYAELAGILVSLVPAYFLMAFVGSYFIKRYTGRMSDQIALATSIASESLNKLTIVHAFGANARLEAKFASYLNTARDAGMKKAFTAAIQLGLLYFIAYSTNALAYWQGSRGIADSIDNGGDAGKIGAVYTVIFLLIDASFILSQVAPFMQIFGTAAGAFEKLNKAITRESRIDGTDRVNGLHLNHIDGAIEFDNVAFAYPSRPDSTVVKDLSMTIPAFKHTAIVGQSGGGKSTVAALLARLYDPSEGSVRLDGVDLRELNVAYLRGCIGAVQQDPALLDRSILENIAHGLINSNAPVEEISTVLDGEVAQFAEQIRKGTQFDVALRTKSSALQSVVRRVLKSAEIADATAFIDRLEHGLATTVGSAGNQFSGGQKQRIALARAMMRDPKILLLDEATSALDSRSERLIQGALREASKGRTTINIAHRLSTVKHADNIIVMRSGKIVEQGSHQALVAADGVYASMVRLQTVGQGEETEDAVQSSAENSGDGISFAEDRTSDETPPKEMTRTSEEIFTMQLDEPDKAPENEEKYDSDKAHKTKQRGLVSTIARVGALTRSQAFYLLFAFTAAAVVGGSYSGEAVIFGHTISSFSSCNTAAAILSAGHFWGLLFFILAIIEFFANLIMGSLFGRVSEDTLYKIRVLCFRTLLGQNADWHESDGRDPSSLLAFITTDANALAGLTGTILGTLFSIIINSIAGIALSLAIAWRISIVLMACVPVLLGAGFMRLRCFKKFHEKHAKAFSSATGFAVEAVNSIRVISMYSLEDEAVNVYHRALKAPYAETLKMLLWSNAWLASSYSVSNLVYALAYWWGTQNIIEGRYSQTQFFIVLPALLFSAQTCGQLFALAPDFSKSGVSAARILDLLEIGKKTLTITPKAIRAGPNIDDDSDFGGEKDIEAGIEKSDSRVGGGAHVRFEGVEFSYPARPDAQVLKGLDLDMRPGQFCALVGPSGAGKSTIISLIERFYRPSSGRVTIDGRNVSDFTSASFRNDIALVPQESVMFEGTLKFNLSLGARPDSEVTDAEIEDACKLANIHETIMALPEKYETRCGPNGNQFSGGQRQRVSIARALLRKPRLLLLDESTSALDSESEKMVQDALENVRQGVTVVAIAHRLHTIEKADRIFVIEEGKCTARGTHKELLRDSETYRTNALHQVLGD
ncbi:ABC multidrug transporter [Lecanosticta acicola]|uniref:ABC multidrug transporter n=1 Tax=Lecanosticta acicola TaxID=111012 RepID=A0AAI8YWY7_9PEZI|nr:ABC multidrug transporter [Lecanosticta acicola]